MPLPRMRRLSMQSRKPPGSVAVALFSSDRSPPVSNNCLENDMTTLKLRVTPCGFILDEKMDSSALRRSFSAEGFL